MVLSCSLFPSFLLFGGAEGRPVVLLFPLFPLFPLFRGAEGRGVE
jgi:hypothetical protein